MGPAQRGHEVGARRKVGCAPLRPCLGSGVAREPFWTPGRDGDTAAAPLDGAVAVFPDRDGWRSPSPITSSASGVGDTNRSVVVVGQFVVHGTEPHGRRLEVCSGSVPITRVQLCPRTYPPAGLSTNAIAERPKPVGGPSPGRIVVKGSSSLPLANVHVNGSGGGGDGVGLPPSLGPEGVIANHTPWIPCPFAWPGL
jgi:hypothetical protein